MKRLSKLYLVAPIVLALAVGVTGCATNQPKKQALVCPDCKMVEVAVDTSRWEPDAATPTASTTRMEHSCPGCQGALKTFFKEGKLQHKCSVCAQNAFTCPVSHRW
jgi:hypothetical protein